MLNSKQQTEIVKKCQAFEKEHSQYGRIMIVRPIFYPDDLLSKQNVLIKIIKHKQYHTQSRGLENHFDTWLYDCSFASYLFKGREEHNKHLQPLIDNFIMEIKRMLY